MTDEAKKEAVAIRDLPGKKWLLLAALLLLIAFAAGSRYGQYIAPRAEEPALMPMTGQPEPEPTAQPAEEIAVHVKGAVAQPGLYRFKAGQRVDDAVRAAAVMAEADLDRLNLAAMLIDGGQVIVPFAADAVADVAAGDTDEAAAIGQQAAKTESLIKEVAANGGGELIGATEETAAAVGGSASGKININTAGVEELQKLSGIGETKAKAIVNYRESNGAFAYPEQITRVSGIGETTYNAIAGDICVE